MIDSVLRFILKRLFWVLVGIVGFLAWDGWFGSTPPLEVIRNQNVFVTSDDVTYTGDSFRYWMTITNKTSEPILGAVTIRLMPWPWNGCTPDPNPKNGCVPMAECTYTIEKPLTGQQQIYFDSRAPRENVDNAFFYRFRYNHETSVEDKGKLAIMTRPTGEIQPLFFWEYYYKPNPWWDWRSFRNRDRYDWLKPPPEVEKRD